MATEVERAWAAGFFDGEGWVSVNRMPSGNYLRMAVAGTEETAVRRFADAMGVGRVNGPYAYKRAGNKIDKAVWYWRASSDEARQALALLEPFLSPHSQAKVARALERVMTYR